jgi:hypothetical protein
MSNVAVPVAAEMCGNAPKPAAMLPIRSGLAVTRLKALFRHIPKTLVIGNAGMG